MITCSKGSTEYIVALNIIFLYFRCVHLFIPGECIWNSHIVLIRNHFKYTKWFCFLPRFTQNQKKFSTAKFVDQRLIAVEVDQFVVFFSACSLIYHNSHLCHLKRFGLSLAKKLYMKKWSQQKIHVYLLLQELYKINFTYVKIYYSRGYIQKIFKLVEMNDGQWMFSNKSIDILRLLYRQN